MAAPCALSTRRRRALRRRDAARGFTLVEMMTVVSILAVMLGILAPSFSGFLASQQAKSLTYDLTADLMLARNEALKRNVSVSITRAGAGWEQGWTVATVATAQQLSRRNAAAQAVSVSGTPAPLTAITFDPNGRVSSPLGSVRMTIGGGTNVRCVELDPSGRVRSRIGGCS
jgi:type IV fimbrial biogenesis protein FimT